MRKKEGRGGVLASLVLFLVVLAVLVGATVGLAGGADEESVAALRGAIERAAVLCYATEGFYPPGLNYIEENYQVQIDYSRYVVRYDVFASNIRPVVTVLAR